MYNHKHCPNCQSNQTQLMATQPHADTIERVRQCMEDGCRTQYVVEYGRPEVIEVYDLE
jgi:transcriptional regulator NrdR family protein